MHFFRTHFLKTWRTIPETTWRGKRETEKVMTEVKRDVEAELGEMKARNEELEAEVGVLQARVRALEAKLEAQVRRVKDAWRQIRQSLGHVLTQVET